jgi:hypothetical protein
MTFVEKNVFSTLYIFGAFVRNQVDVAMGIFIWVFYSVHWFSCLFLCQYPVAFIAMALQYSIKSEILIPPVLLSLLSITWAI